MSAIIKPLMLPLSDDPDDAFGGVRLRRYQAMVRKCTAPRILVSAPTGSGKTLAYLSRALKPSEGEPYHTLIIVYPTNALIWDQTQALKKLLTSVFNLKVTTVSADNLTDLEEQPSEGDVMLLVANGETLAALAQEAKSSEGSAFFRALRREFDTRIILTNPDILFYLFLYRFARQESLIQALLHEKPPNMLVLDEFHLYFGYSLANLVYMLTYIRDSFDQIIFGSATPIPIDELIHEKFETIVAHPSDKGQVAVHGYTIGTQPIPGLIGQDEIDRVVQAVEKMYNKHISNPQKVKVLVILNSVLSCVDLQHKLDEKYPGHVTPIHGLVPLTARPHTQEEFGDIVVGTSAIEVGVDFDTASLIFEATDSSTFMQRLGRGARHSECDVQAYIPALYYPRLTQFLTGTMTQSQLTEAIWEALPKPETYLHFPYSKQAAPLLQALYLNWVYKRPAGQRTLSIGQAEREMCELYQRGSFNIPTELVPLAQHAFTTTPDACVHKMSHEESLRSTLNSIPAIFSSYDPPIFDYVSLPELPKLVFRVKSAEEVTASSLKIPRKMRFESVFLDVSGIRRNPPRLCVSVNINKYSDKPRPLYGAIVTHDPVDKELEQEVWKLVKGQPAIRLESARDWRLTGLQICRGGGYLVIGGDAYLAWYINENLA